MVPSQFQSNPSPQPGSPGAQKGNGKKPVCAGFTIGPKASATSQQSTPSERMGALPAGHAPQPGITAPESVPAQPSPSRSGPQAVVVASSSMSPSQSLSSPSHSSAAPGKTAGLASSQSRSGQESGASSPANPSPSASGTNGPEPGSQRSQGPGDGPTAVTSHLRAATVPPVLRSTQVSNPLQTSPSSQSAFSRQEKVQSGSQPSSAVELPSSHSSVPSTSPSPQPRGTHRRSTQTPSTPIASPQTVPSGSQSSTHAPPPTQRTPSRQGASRSGQSHSKRHSTQSARSPSHSSPAFASTNPSPHTLG